MHIINSTNTSIRQRTCAGPSVLPSFKWVQAFYKQDTVHLPKTESWFLISKFIFIYFTVNVTGANNTNRYIHQGFLNRDSFNRGSTVSLLHVKPRITLPPSPHGRIFGLDLSITPSENGIPIFSWISLKWKWKRFCLRSQGIWEKLKLLCSNMKGIWRETTIVLSFGEVWEIRNQNNQNSTVR